MCWCHDSIIVSVITHVVIFGQFVINPRKPFGWQRTFFLVQVVTYANYITHVFVNVKISQQYFSCISDKGENFQFDHAALLSILRNEGVSTTGLESVTPKSKPYNYLVSWFYNCLFLFRLATMLLSQIFRMCSEKSYTLWQWSYLQPQRVSVMKSRQKVAPPAGKHKSVNIPCSYLFISSDLKVIGDVSVTCIARTSFILMMHYFCRVWLNSLSF